MKNLISDVLHGEEEATSFLAQARSTAAKISATAESESSALIDKAKTEANEQTKATLDEATLKAKDAYDRKVAETQAGIDDFFEKKGPDMEKVTQELLELVLQPSYKKEL